MKKSVSKLFLIILFTIIFTMLLSSFKHTTNLQAKPLAFGDYKPRNSVGATNWMASVQGSKYLWEINIPGTHDSGTKRIDMPDNSKTQDLYLDDQLKAGVRLFDCRFKAEDGKLIFCHGEQKKSVDVDIKITKIKIPLVGDLQNVAECTARDRNGNDLTFDTFVNYCRDFLQAHPSETILFSPKYESRDRGEYKKLLIKKAKKLIEEGLLYEGNNAPTLDEVRGKMVMLRQHTDEATETTYGIGDPSDFASRENKFDAQLNYYVDKDPSEVDYDTPLLPGEESLDDRAKQFISADIYNEWEEEKGKKDTIISCLKRIHEKEAVGDWKFRLNYIYTSSYVTKALLPYPADVYKYVNPGFTNGTYDLRENSGYHYGWWLIDDINSNIAAKIWKTNAVFHPVNIHYVSNGTEISSQIYDASDVLNSDASRKGYTFTNRWKDRATGRIINNNSKIGVYFSDYSDVYLDAVFEPNKFKFEFDLNGGSFKEGSKYYNHAYGNYTYDGEPFNINEGDEVDIPYKKGYIFSGWTKSDHDKYNDEFLNDKVGNINSNTLGDFGLSADKPSVVGKVYAIWKPNTFSISYDSNSGELPEGVSDKTSCTYDELSILLRNEDEPVKKGYKFKGWSSVKYTDYSDDYLASTYNYLEDYLQFEPLGIDVDINNSSSTVYALWKPNTLRITYDTNGGNLPKGASTFEQYTYDGEPLYLNDPTKEEIAYNVIPYRSGYQFRGWSITKHSDYNESYKEELVTKIDKNNLESLGINSENIQIYTRVYAMWEPNSYMIQCNCNQGEFEDGSTYENYYTYDGSPLLLPLGDNAPKRKGYMFKGWTSTKYDNYSSDYTTIKEIDNSKLSLLINNIQNTSQIGTLYALWEPVEYRINYNLNGGRLASTITMYGKYLYNSETLYIPTDSNNFTKDGYEFVGWTIEQHDDYNDSYLDELVSHFNLYNIYDLGLDYYSAEKNGDVYALWRPLTYSLIYDANGGELNEQSNKFEEYTYDGNPTTIGSDTYKPRKANYVFVGWTNKKYSNYSDNCLSSIVSTFDKNNFQTLGVNVKEPEISSVVYALWKPNKYIIDYDANLGEFKEGTLQYGEFGLTSSNLILPSNENGPVRNGYVFKGWTINKYDDYKIEYENNIIFEINKLNVTSTGVDTFVENSHGKIYALWKPLDYAVSLNLNGGENIQNFVCNYYYEFKGDAVNIPSALGLISKAGYKFVGWTATKHNDYKPEYEEELIDKFDESIFDEIGIDFDNPDAYGRLYALWKPNDYSITYDANEGHFIGGQVPEIKFNYGFNESIPIRKNEYIPQRDGYVFVGWSAVKHTKYLDQYLSDVYEFVNSTNYTYFNVDINDENVKGKVYALWKPREFTINLNPNEGSFGRNIATTVKYVYNSEPVSFPSYVNTPTRTGYTFAGWSTSKYTDENFQDTKDYIYEINSSNFESFGFNLNDETVTSEIFAVWDMGTCKIICNPAGGYYDNNTGRTISTPYQFDSISLPSSSTDVPKRNGYEFRGWTKFYYMNYTYAYENNVISTITMNDLESIGINVEQDKLAGVVYALWKPKTFNVQYDPNGGIISGGAFDLESYQLDSPQKQLRTDTTQMTKLGYSFVGWTTKQYDNYLENYENDIVRYVDMSNIESMNIDLSDNSVNGKLYALWKPNTYRILYNSIGTFKPGVSKYLDHIYDSLPSVLLDGSDNIVYNGHQFVGWTATSYTEYSDNLLSEVITKVDNDVLSSLSGLNMSKDKASVKLYALWKPQIYTFDFDLNQGNVPEGTELKGQYEYEGNSEYLDKFVPNPTRVGYKFAGWTKNKHLDYSSDYLTEVVSYIVSSNLDSFNLDAADITKVGRVYALWQPMSYIMKAYSNGGKFGTKTSINFNYTTSETEVEIGSILNAVPTRDGYTFVGWSSNQYMDYKDEYLDNVTNVINKDNLELLGIDLNNSSTINSIYAVWKPNIYSIKLNENGGKFDDDVNVNVSFEYASTSSRMLSDLSKVKKPGYTCIGFTVRKHLTYDASYVTTTFNELNSANAARMGIPIGSPEKIINIYALWKPITYKIVYNENGGTNRSGILPYGNYVYGSSNLVLPTENMAPYRLGYSFMGWTIDAKSDYNDSYLSSVFTTVSNRNMSTLGFDINSDNTQFDIYALWKPTVYNIKLNSKDGIFKDNSLEYSINYKTEDGDVSISDDAYYPYKQGYDFKGFVLDDYDEYSEDLLDNVINKPINLSNLGEYGIDVTNVLTQGTIYALWKPKEYTVKYAVNGGSLKENNVIEDSKFKLGMEELNLDDKSTNLYRDGYSFVGWTIKHYTDYQEDYENELVSSIDEENLFNIVKDADSTTSDNYLYALWKPNSYIVEYDTLNGQFPEGVQNHGTYQYNSYRLDLPTASSIPSKPGYEFVGWTISKHDDYSDEYLAEIIKYIDISNIEEAGIDFNNALSKAKVYALYKPLEYKIMYDSNGGSYFNEEYNHGFYTYGLEDLVLPKLSMVPRKTGYRFKGFTINKYDQYDSSLENSIIESVNYSNLFDLSLSEESSDNGLTRTIYALWEPAKYNIKLCSNINVFGTQSDEEEIVQYTYDGQAIPFNDNPKKDSVEINKYYNFVGWFADPNGETPVSFVDKTNFEKLGGSFIDMKSEATVYAIYIQKALSISVNEESKHIELSTQKDGGYGLKCTQQINYSYTQETIAPSEIEWKVEDPKVCSVTSKNGKVTVKGLTYGKTNVYATFYGVIFDEIEVQTRFWDVPNKPGSATYDAIFWAADNKITGGYDGGAYFDPKADTQRIQFAIFLWKHCGSPEPNGTVNLYTKFSDCSKYKTTSASYKSIAWCVEKGIVGGYSDGTFKPTASITRTQVMLMLYRYAREMYPYLSLDFDPVNPFSDVNFSPTKDTYKSILWGYTNSITAGYSKGTSKVFKINDPCQRSSMLIMLHKFDKLVQANKPQPPEGDSGQSDNSEQTGDGEQSDGSEQSENNQTDNNQNSENTGE